MARRSLAGGAKKRPTRYEGGAASDLLARALRAHRKGAIGEAIEGYRAVLAGAPRSLDAWMNLGTALVQVGLARAAEEALLEAGALGARDARVQRDVGIGLSALGRHELALRALTEAMRLDPEQGGARLFAIRVALDAGDRDAAGAWAREAVATRPHDASAHLELHRVVFDDRAPGPAIDAASSALAIDAADGVARLFLGAALWMAGDLAGAHAILDDPSMAPDRREALAFAFRSRLATTRFFAHRREALLLAAAESARSDEAAGVDAVGDVRATVELGVRHGVSLRWLAEAISTPIHGFDSFEGLPTHWLGRAPGAFSTGGEVPEVPAHVELHVGLFADTLPPFVATSTAPLRLLHVDSDLYESARTGLTLLAPRLTPGTILVFDEYLGNTGWQAEEHRALEETAADRGWRLEPLAFSWITGQAAFRIG